MERDKALEKKINKICSLYKVKLKLTHKERRASAIIHERIILINPSNGNLYDIMHEIGHIICGYSCCREHAEWEAHGAAKALCQKYNFDIGDAEERMEGYAHRSNPKACGRYFNPTKHIPTDQAMKELELNILSQIPEPFLEGTCFLMDVFQYVYDDIFFELTNRMTPDIIFTEIISNIKKGDEDED